MSFVIGISAGAPSWHQVSWGVWQGKYIHPQALQEKTLKVTHKWHLLPKQVEIFNDCYFNLKEESDTAIISLQGESDKAVI